ncbi:MAG: cytochrome bc complex cytochrome b subunit [Candidatus Thermoplasmatota archaeon]|nr:cytochrome bc complex cytochrome b subunit [Candidatus Thermoplasmatota archaeon]
MSDIEEKNNYTLTDIMKEEPAPPGSYTVSIRAVTKKEFRIDYWTGSFLLASLLYLGFSGILLFYYFEQGNPYNSTLSIINNVYLGHLILTSHLFMAYAMIVLLYFHMFRNYFVGAYKGKFRWLQWLLGVLLFLLVYVEAILGYLLSLSYIGVSALHVMELLIERSVIGRLLPALSNWLIAVLIGDGSIPSTVGHLLALHVALVGGLIVIVAMVHFFLFEKSGPYKLGENDAKGAANAQAEEKYVRWYPYNLAYMVFTSIVFIAIILIFSAFFMQVLPAAYGTLEYHLTPFPDWYIMPVYKLMDLAGYGLTTGGVPLVIYFLLALLFIPFIDRYRGKGALERPMITVFGVFFLIALPIMALWGYSQPGLTQTRILTMAMWWGMTFVSVVTVYAMRFAKRDFKDEN